MTGHEGDDLGAQQVKRAEAARLPAFEVDAISALTVAITMNIQQGLAVPLSPQGMHLLFTNIEELLASLRPLIPGGRQ